MQSRIHFPLTTKHPDEPIGVFAFPIRIAAVVPTHRHRTTDTRLRFQAGMLHQHFHLFLDFFVFRTE